ncbi:MAG: Holliday junction resolvase RuvX, partial [Chloroflexota bacterium]
LAEEHQVGLIIIGQALDDEGRPTYSGRKAWRMAGVIKMLTSVPVEMWDESHSTQDARAARIAQGVSRKKRAGHLDASAAAIILDSYIKAHE